MPTFIIEMMDSNITEKKEIKIIFGQNISARNYSLPAYNAGAFRQETYKFCVDYIYTPD